VINLRGRVIPVIELRAKFGLESREYDERTCIIVVEVQGASETVQVGMIVDSVSEVLAIPDEDIEPPPSFGGHAVDVENIMGMAKVEGEVRILLNVDRVIGIADLEDLGER